jgi:phosphate transport system substrate-binding protein
MRRVSLPILLAGLLANAAVVTSAAAGSLAIVGTGDGLDMLRQIAVRFVEGHPGTEIQVPVSIGSGGGIAAVAADREKLGRVARPLSESETAQGIAVFGIARIPSAIYVNPSVKIANLSTQQLGDIFSGAVVNWQDLGGSDAKIRVVRREEGDSTLQALRTTMPGWKDIAITPLSKLAQTTQEAVETVSKVEGAVSFGPYSRGLEPGVRVLSIDGMKPDSPNYPSAVTLSLIYKPARVDAEIRSFLDFVHSDQGRAVIEAFGAVPLKE